MSAPAALDLDRAVADARAVAAAHAADDALGERNPDLLVVLELRVFLEALDSVDPRLLVALRVEVETVVPARATVGIGAQLGPRPGQCEIDVEEDRAEGQTTAEDSLGLP